MKGNLKKFSELAPDFLNGNHDIMASQVMVFTKKSPTLRNS